MKTATMPTDLAYLCNRLREVFNEDDTPDELSNEAADAIEELWKERDAHQRKAGQSKSPKKLKALAKARKLAAKANRSENPSPSALYQRKRRARLKLKAL